MRAANFYIIHLLSMNGVISYWNRSYFLDCHTLGQYLWLVHSKKKDGTAMIDETARKEKPTFDQLVHTMQATWWISNALYAFCAAAPGAHMGAGTESRLHLLPSNGVVGNTHETRVVELMLAEDGEPGVASGGPVCRQHQVVRG
jgi:hypothetical protein